MKLFHSHGHVVGGSLLIAGTTIGVGMLALPIATGPAGFAPSVFIYLLCWLFMLCTGLLLLEACIRMPPDSNLISMADHYLGTVGKVVCWLVYLFLFETVMIAHVVGGGNIFTEIFGHSLNPFWATVLYVILFSPVVYLGTKAVDRINMIMFLGVILSYLSFIFVAYRYVNGSFLAFQNWGKVWFTLPILFTAFTYQVIIPTLMTYLKRDVKKVRLAIICGTSIPLVVYVVWQVVILGIVPIDGPYGLLQASAKGQNAINPLRHFIGSPVVHGIGKAFGFFTMTTSYIALSLAFVDFLADGLKVKKVGLKKVALCLAIFLPPTIIALSNPHVFLTALSYAGGISCAILFGLYPPLMVWVSRYKLKDNKNRQLPGGKAVLVILMIFIALEFCLELMPKIL